MHLCLNVNYSTLTFEFVTILPINNMYIKFTKYIYCYSNIFLYFDLLLEIGNAYLKILMRTNWLDMTEFMQRSLNY